MSDDTPTQRFGAAGSDASTQRMDAASPPVAEEVAEDERGSRRLIIILSTIGGLLLIALVVVLVLLLTRGGGETPIANIEPSDSSTPSITPSISTTPSEAPSPSASPSETEDPPPPPPPPPPSTEVEIVTFAATQEVNCNNQTGNPVYVEFAWQSENGIAAYFGIDTDDAQTGGMGWTLPPNGTHNDFPVGFVPFEYVCYNPSMTYTLTVVGTDGSKDTQKFTVTNVGDHSS